MKPVHYNRLNLKNLITVTPRICHNSTGVTREYSFQCIYPSIIIELTQVVPIEEGKPRESEKDLFIYNLHIKAINSLKWWRRLFPASLNISGLLIKCYTPQLRKLDDY